MEATNPFKQKIPQKVQFSCKVWLANADGKDTSQGTSFLTLGEEYLWLSKDFSVPLNWILSIENLGPGFALFWNNPISNENEAAIFCIRTFFGYDTQKRDHIVALVHNAVAKSPSIPVPPPVAIAEHNATCQRCGTSQAQVYDLDTFICVIMHWVKKPSRVVMCSDHARSRFFRIFFSNMILGNLGVGMVVSPLINLANVNEVRRKGAIGSTAALLCIAVGFIPYLLVFSLFAWAVYYVVTF